MGERGRRNDVSEDTRSKGQLTVLVFQQDSRRGTNLTNELVVIATDVYVLALRSIKRIEVGDWKALQTN